MCRPLWRNIGRSIFFHIQHARLVPSVYALRNDCAWFEESSSSLHIRHSGGAELLHGCAVKGVELPGHGGTKKSIPGHLEHGTGGPTPLVTLANVRDTNGTEEEPHPTVLVACVR